MQGFGLIRLEADQFAIESFRFLDNPGIFLFKRETCMFIANAVMRERILAQVVTLYVGRSGFDWKEAKAALCGSVHAVRAGFRRPGQYCQLRPQSPVAS